MSLRQSPVILLEDTQASRDLPAARLYSAPVRIVTATRPEEVDSALRAVDAGLRDGLHAAGWIAYEAAAAYEPRLRARLQRMPDEPLVWFGLFDGPDLLTGREAGELLDDGLGGSRRNPALAHIAPAMTAAAYDAALAYIFKAIDAGDIYQINYAFNVDLGTVRDCLALYARLRAAQPVRYGAYIDSGPFRVLSLSPELFLRSRGGRLEARPMKGTAPRGRDLREDRAAAARLAADEKSRAENLMIVDLLRNDLSRVATPGSVRTPALYDVETYRSVLQMTSTVEAVRRDGTGLADIMAALFPCGSIVGAPKLRAMEYIADLESAPRGIYTGAIGWAAPDGDFCFSVAIRTLVADAHGQTRFGVGSGIVADSNAAAEYAECQLKAAFLETEESPGFALIETLGWRPGSGYAHLDRHLARLRDSARYYAIDYDASGLRRRLVAMARDFTSPTRVRLLLARDGAATLSTEPLRPWPSPLRMTIARERLNSGDAARRHKTTDRAVYDRALAELQQSAAADEPVFVNENGELCDGARSTLFLERDGRLLTPPVDSGALPGVLRAHMLETGQASEAALRMADLRRATRIYVGNAARGLTEAILV